MFYDDTIAAIATPPGAGGIGIVRLSGPDALPILSQIFAPTRPGPWRAGRVRHGHAVDPTGTPVDEALALPFRAPHSFTAEDVAEIQCHGGPLVTRAVLDLAVRAGARPAEPGEFTLRAFRNGRIDLTRAEALLDVITARTSAGLALAQAQLGGWLADAVRAARQQVLGPLAYCTVLVDFPEDEVEPQPLGAEIAAALAAVERLLQNSAQGVVYRQGARAVLAGVPNVGKSSLLNALLTTERAIVTPVAGTTRDTIEETADLGGVPVVLTDTAGLTETADPVELIGVQRSAAAVRRADLVLLVLDATRAPDDRDARVAALVDTRPCLLVWNKADLAAPGTFAARPAGCVGEVAVSAVTGAGLAELGALVARTLLGTAPTGDTQLVSNDRHRDALRRAAGHLRDALDGHGRGVPPDLLAVDLRAAVSALGEITGEDADTDLLSTIFSRFCIGK